MDKFDIIKNIYYQPDGYASMKDTYKKAKEKDKNIKMEDVKAWFNENVPRTTQLKGQNSYIPPYSNFEYEADLFFIMKPEDLEYKIALLVIDKFSKFTSVMMLKNKTPDVILPALQQAFITLGGIPKVLVSDSEGSLMSKELNKYYKENDITHIILKSHAPTAERMVRTLKNIIFKRLKSEPDKTWYQIIHEVLITLNYIRKSSATNMIPNEARKPENFIKVKGFMERHRKDSRKYPPIKVGDFVRVYRKRKNFEKETAGLWTDKKYEVKQIEDVPDVGKLFHVEGQQHPLLRSEILLI